MIKIKNSLEVKKNKTKGEKVLKNKRHLSKAAKKGALIFEKMIQIICRKNKKEKKRKPPPIGRVSPTQREKSNAKKPFLSFPQTLFKKDKGPSPQEEESDEPMILLQCNYTISNRYV